MMKTKIKRIAWLLLLVLLLTTAVACSDQGDTPNTDTTSSGDNSNTDTEILMPELPDRDFEDHTFRVLHWQVGSWPSRMNKDIFAESQNGDTINDAVYKRNLTVSEKYNIQFSIQFDEYNTIPQTFTNFITAQDDEYDLVYLRLFEAASLMTTGYFVDFNSVPYIDLSKPWWDQNAVNNLSIGGKLYLMASDINIIDKDATAALTFNKAVAENHNLPNLYEIVQNNAWTMEALRNTYQNVSADLDGNGEMDETDLWGFLGGCDVVDSFFNGAGGRFASKDENDMPVYTFESERNFDIISKILDIMYDRENFYNHHTGTAAAPATDDTQYRQMFENGHGLFFWTRLDEVTTMRSSDTEFGILPIPKYDELQENYLSLVSVHTTGLMSIPITASNLERTGIILEALAAESKYTLQPAYYDVALKGKSVRDDESSDMLDIIFGNRVFDIGIIYNFGSFSYTCQQMPRSGSTNVVSLYESYKNAIEGDINSFIEQVTKID